MKVLHCIPGMGGGGAERQLTYLAGGLRTRGWEVHVALARSGPNLARLEAQQAIVHRVGAGGNHDPRIATRLARVFSRVRPDVVQVWFIQMEVVGGLLARMFQVPWVMSERSSLLAYPPTIKNGIRLRLGRQADAIVANSDGGRRYWVERRAGGPAPVVIPNSVPLQEIDAALPAVPAAVPIREGDRIVLFAGRFGAEKNIETLIDALATVVDQPGVCAILCGDGPLYDAIKGRVTASGLDGRVFTPGYVEDLWPLMKRASVLVSVGLFEGRPNVVIEAMAARCPVVVSDIAAHREILDDASARWVQADDAASIAEGIRAVLANSHAASAQAARARQIAEGWSIEAAADAYDRVYRDVIAMTRRNVPPQSS